MYMKCGVCGSDSNRTGIYCPECGNQYGLGTKKLPPAAASQYGSVHVRANTISYPEESEYFNRKFAQFDTKGGYAITFNWVPFVIAPLWYMYKGLWGKAFLLMLIFHLSGGLAAPILWCYAGFCGNYDYYLKKVKGTQWW